MRKPCDRHMSEPSLDPSIDNQAVIRKVGSKQRLPVTGVQRSCNACNAARRQKSARFARRALRKDHEEVYSLRLICRLSESQAGL